MTAPLRNNPLKEMLESRDWILADGATGTNLFNMGLSSGDAPELWNVEEPAKIRALYQGSVGAGSDLFWLYSDASSADVADITDFVPGEDFLRISLNPQLGPGPGTLAVETSDDGADGVVRIDGVTVAILRGAPDATQHDIYVETRPDVFP